MIRNMSQTILSVMLAALIVCLAMQAQAKVSVEEAEKLKNELNPMGGIRAGNKEGTIPAWTGGLSKVPENVNYDPEKWLPDPYAEDKILFTITAENVDQYKDKLSKGVLELFKKYPDTWKMHIYPTRRSVAYSEDHYKETYNNAQTAQIVDEKGSVENFYKGIIFPIPTNGAEAITNHMNRPQGTKNYQTHSTSVVAYPDGTRLITKLHNRWNNFVEYTLKEEWDAKDIFVSSIHEFLYPANRKGSVSLRVRRADWRGGEVGGWSYLPGQRRVRRMPNMFYDGIDPSSGGLITADDALMYESPLDRFDWKLEGKKEMFIPYNCYAYGYATVEEATPNNHENPELLRWELHRVWVNVSTLKKGARHVYSKRVFYQDEDSWLVAVKDTYDMNGELWRMSLAHTKQYYDVPVYRINEFFNYDFQVAFYVVTGLLNGNEPDNTKDIPESFFTLENLRKMGRR